MSRTLVAVLVLAVVPFAPAVAGAQAPATAKPAAAAQPEIKLDEQASLKAAALEARMAAIVANFALLQRQAQDMQQEMKQILDDRKKLIEDAGRKSRVEVPDANEWQYDPKGQRYVKITRPAGAPSQPPAR